MSESAFSVDQIDPVFFTDDYPRAGCVVEVRVPAQPGGLYHVVAANPKGKILESYIADTPLMAAVVALAWMGGAPPARGYRTMGEQDLLRTVGLGRLETEAR